jgi:beta-1,3-galactosyltransferase
MEKQCPYSVSSINRTLEKGIRGIYEELEIPCGLVVDSAITIVAVPWGAEGSFAIELLGPSLPGDINPPIILHYNVRLLGDKLTNDAVIVQNTWSREREWGDEERCPLPDASPKKGQ